MGIDWSWFGKCQKEVIKVGIVGFILFYIFTNINKFWGNMERSTIYVMLATFFSFMFSIYLFFFMDSPDNKLYGIFVGIWVPSILSAFTVLKSSFKREN